VANGRSGSANLPGRGSRARPASQLLIRRRVPDPRDAEDILQDVFSEFVEANRLLMPIDNITGWLFRVARNRIIDLFRKKKTVNFSDTSIEDEDDELLQFEDLLPSPDAGPDALYARSVLLAAFELAVDEPASRAARSVRRARNRRAQLQGNCRPHRRWA